MSVELMRIGECIHRFAIQASLTDGIIGFFQVFCKIFEIFGRQYQELLGLCNDICSIL